VLLTAAVNYALATPTTAPADNDFTVAFVSILRSSFEGSFWRLISRVSFAGYVECVVLGDDAHRQKKSLRLPLFYPYT
jgi:hypothetical protein